MTNELAEHVGAEALFVPDEIQDNPLPLQPESGEEGTEDAPGKPTDAFVKGHNLPAGFHGLEPAAGTPKPGRVVVCQPGRGLRERVDQSEETHRIKVAQGQLSEKVLKYLLLAGWVEMPPRTDDPYEETRYRHPDEPGTREGVTQGTAQMFQEAAERRGRASDEQA